MNFTSILGDSLPTNIRQQAKALAELVKKSSNTDDDLKRIRILSESIALHVAITIMEEEGK